MPSVIVAALIPIWFPKVGGSWDPSIAPAFHAHPTGVRFESRHIPKLVKVNAGAMFHGLIALTAHNGNRFNYNSKFTNVKGTGLDVNNVAELKGVMGALEAYSIQKKADYPTGKIILASVNLKLANGDVPGVKWATAQYLKDRIKTT
ncbi:hypothetical protein B0H16DRAFT_1475397 [Mycena metata]|uniref:Uncharacterized protein n=1 Tax=Mycena metata TaxID=1033252 RepID=A0AAD7HF28_9AGAR|nr:hypothetical protein B0H16DRAFT_1475397 [Mycena metata]